MLRYFWGMRFRTNLLLLSTLILLAVSAGCGEDSGTTDGFIAPESQGAGIEIAGNIASNIDFESILVFAFLRSGEEASNEPVSLGVVDDEGSFILTGLPPGKIGVTFLADSTNDGAIDPNDQVSHLDDPDQQLDDLQTGDQAHIVDVQLDFRSKRAVAEAIEVIRANDSPEPQSTPTPEG